MIQPQAGGRPAGSSGRNFLNAELRKIVEEKASATAGPGQKA